jgi:hypothetical protein
MAKKKPIIKAVELVSKQLRNDEDYRRGWVANIAMQFVDEIARLPKKTYLSKTIIHQAANKAAENFINLLIQK